MESWLNAVVELRPLPSVPSVVLLVELALVLLVEVLNEGLTPLPTLAVLTELLLSLVLLDVKLNSGMLAPPPPTPIGVAIAMATAPPLVKVCVNCVVDACTVTSTLVSVPSVPDVNVEDEL